MNTLSLVIYFIGMLDVVNIAIGWLIGVSIVMLFCMAGAYFLKSVNGINEVFPALLWKKTYISMLLVGIFLSAVVPSRTTALLIASSEIGERVLSSESVKSAIDPGADLLKTWMNQQKNEIEKKIKDN